MNRVFLVFYIETFEEMIDPLVGILLNIPLFLDAL